MASSARSAEWLRDELASLNPLRPHAYVVAVSARWAVFEGGYAMPVVGNDSLFGPIVEWWDDTLRTCLGLPDFVGTVAAYDEEMALIEMYAVEAAK